MARQQDELQRRSFMLLWSYKKNWFVFFCALPFLGCVGVNPYCSFKCGNTHTLCQYQHCPNMCGPHAQIVRMQDENRSTILRLHNNLRSNISTGNMYKNLERAKNLHLLFYDVELEFIAQCWANRCYLEGEYDTCRISKQWPFVDQNYFVTKTMVPTTYEKHIWALAFGHWSSGSMYFSRSLVLNYIPNPEYNFFARMISEELRAIGCAQVSFGGTSSRFYSVVCNYGPSDLRVGMRLYESVKETPCTEYSEYSGLCGKVMALNKSYTPPFKFESWDSHAETMVSIDKTLWTIHCLFISFVVTIGCIL